MSIIEKVNKLINSIDTKGKVTIQVLKEESDYWPGCAHIRLSLIDNSLCCDFGINKDRFDEFYGFIKEQLNKKVRLLTDERYRNNEHL